MEKYFEECELNEPNEWRFSKITFVNFIEAIYHKSFETVNDEQYRESLNFRNI